MLQQRFREDDTVVRVEATDVPLEVRENPVHETIEHGTAVCPAIREAAVLKETMVCDKCEEMTVFFAHIAAVICPTNVDLREALRAREAVERVTEKR
jgi:hypothetical protein